MRSKSGNLKILCLTSLTIMITAFFGCTNHNVITSVTPISLNITSPESGVILQNNLLRVTGQVSPVESLVQVKETMIEVDKNGVFYAYVDLAEGKNIISLVAEYNGNQVEKQVAVTFEKPLVLFLDEPEPVPGLDYTKNPLTLTGGVTYPLAKVTVNDTEASVKSDGSYSVSIQLKTGQNFINLQAKAGDKQDELNYVIDVSADGKLTYPPPLMMGKSMLFLENGYIKSGEAISANISLKTGRDIRVPTNYNQKIFFTNESFDDNNMPTPEGLHVDIQPGSFKIYPGVQYVFTLNISANGNIKPDTYYLKFENFLNDEKWMENDSKLYVN